MSDFLIHALAGGLSGVTVDSILFPLDTIKTRLQARKSGTAVQPLGFRSFYNGLASAMAGSFPSAATFWVAYQAAKAAMEPVAMEKGLDFFVPGVAAAAANVAVVGVRNPFEVVKQQMQSGLHSTTRQAVQTILRVDGWRGFYAGYLSTVLREIPFDATQFILYEAMKRQLSASRKKELVLWENCLIGSVAGGISAGLTTPLDVVKTRLMTQTKTVQADRYRGVVHALRRIYAEEGIRALYLGIQPRVMWISLGGAIFFGTFEELRRQFTALSRVD